VLTQGAVRHCKTPVKPIIILDNSKNLRALLKSGIFKCFNNIFLYSFRITLIDILNGLRGINSFIGFNLSIFINIDNSSMDLAQKRLEFLNILSKSNALSTLNMSLNTGLLYSFYFLY
jgi:hypothetical protein